MAGAIITTTATPRKAATRKEEMRIKCEKKVCNCNDPRQFHWRRRPELDLDLETTATTWCRRPGIQVGRTMTMIDHLFRNPKLDSNVFISFRVLMDSLAGGTVIATSEASESLGQVIAVANV